MAYLADWLQGLIVLLIFAGLVEMLVPQGSTRRYVRIALGLLILLALLAPVVELLGLEPDWSDAMPTELAPQWQGAAPAGQEAMARLRDGPGLERVRQVLARRLETAMRQELARLERVRLAEVTVHWRQAAGSGDPGFAGLTVVVVPQPDGQTAPGERATVAGEETRAGIRIAALPQIRIGGDNGGAAGDQAAPPVAGEDPAARPGVQASDDLQQRVAAVLERRFGLLPHELEIRVRPGDESEEGGLR